VVYFVLFCFVLFYFVLFCVVLFCFVLFCFVLFYGGRMPGLAVSPYNKFDDPPWN